MTYCCVAAANLYIMAAGTEQDVMPVITNSRRRKNQRFTISANSLNKNHKLNRRNLIKTQVTQKNFLANLCSVQTVADKVQEPCNTCIYVSAQETVLHDETMNTKIPVKITHRSNPNSLVNCNTSYTNTLINRLNNKGHNKANCIQINISPCPANISKSWLPSSSVASPTI